MSPDVQTKRALGKVGPTSTTRRRTDPPHPPRLQWPSQRCALRVAANFPRELLSNLLEVGERGQRRGQGQRGEAGRAPARSADLPEYLLMYPSPSPSQVWKRRRIRSSSPVLDVSLLLLPPPPPLLPPPLALPAAAIMRPLPAWEEEDARPREESARRKSYSQPRTCLTTEHAQWPPGRSGRGIPALRVLPGLGRWAPCNRRSGHLSGEGGREGGSWSRGARDGEGTRGHGRRGRVHRRSPGRVSTPCIQPRRGPLTLGGLKPKGACSRQNSSNCPASWISFQEKGKHFLFANSERVFWSQAAYCARLGGILYPSPQMRPFNETL